MSDAALVVLHAQLATAYVERHAVLVLPRSSHGQQRVRAEGEPRDYRNPRTESVVGFCVHNAPFIAGPYVCAQPNRVVVRPPQPEVKRVDPPPVTPLAVSH
eukprot:3046731-Prymnesium_polylepis.2